MSRTEALSGVKIWDHLDELLPKVQKKPKVRSPFLQVGTRVKFRLRCFEGMIALVVGPPDSRGRYPVKFEGDSRTYLFSRCQIEVVP